MSLTYFSVTDNGDSELWVTDGTVAGTRLVKTFAANPITPITDITIFKGRAYFAADDGVDGVELWTSDGTTAGTTLVSDSYSGSTSGFPDYLTIVNGSLLFAATDATHDRELWISDGTPAGTAILFDVYLGANGSSASDFVNVSGTLDFVARDPTHDVELWRSDGTAAGTFLVKDINPGSGGSYGSVLTNVNGELFLYADDGTHGIEIWKSDGTAAGTILVDDVYPGHASGVDSSVPFGVINNELFFSGYDDAHGYELWKTDGTAVGTNEVIDINPGVDNSLPSSLTKFNGQLFFAADDGVHGRELWKSDGTAAGTVMVADINPSGSSITTSDPMVVLNGKLYFAADDGTHGLELWTSDGTAAGTTMVADLATGSDQSWPHQLTVVNGSLEFYAYGSPGLTNPGLFISDVTAAGTTQLATNVDFNTSLGTDPVVVVQTQPVVTASNYTAVHGASIAATSLFSVSMAAGDAITAYQFWDSTPDAVSGYWAIGGLQQSAGRAIDVTAGQIASTRFQSESGTDHLWVRVSDGAFWSDWKSFDVIAPPDQAPVVTAPDYHAAHGAVIAAASLFTVSDSENDAITAYQVWDSTADSSSGYWMVGGVAQPAGRAIDVMPGSLSGATFNSGSGTDDLWVRAKDGSTWSSWQEFHVIAPPDQAPVVSGSDAGLVFNSSIAVASLFSVTDADGDTMKTYELWDSVNPSSNAHFVLNGAIQPSGQSILLDATQFGQTNFVAASAPATDRIWERAFDGSIWSDWAAINIISHA